MTNVGSQNITPSNTTHAITAGYHDGTGVVATDANLVTGNIKSGATIFGVAGDANVVNTSTGDAVAGDMLTGKVAWVDGAEVTGSVPAGANISGANGSKTFTITDGIYSGNKTATANDADLIAANIATGVNIFGVAGSAVVSTGDAVAANVLATKTFSKTGSAGLTGTMVNVGTQNITPSNTTHAITAGYHDGTGVVATDANLITGNIKSGATIFGVAGDANVVNTSTGDAVAGDMLTGKIAWVDGAEVTGSVPAGANVSGADGSKTFTITDGLYSGNKTATANDADLIAANIKTGVNILGTAGTFTADANAVATEIAVGKTAYVNGAKITGTLVNAVGLYKTGQTVSYDATGAVVNPKVPTNPDDGYYEKGLANKAPRFNDNGDGTVTDNNTGLIWLKNANVSAATRTWANALADVAELNTSGTMNTNAAGDTSNGGSHQTDWRLPNKNELHSLCHSGYYDPALSNTAGTGQWTEGDPFTGVQSNSYWSGTTTAGNTTYAWFVDLNFGYVFYNLKANSFYVWPVRGGQ